jgi:hypothetical protein
MDNRLGMSSSASESLLEVSESDVHDVRELCDPSELLVASDALSVDGEAAESSERAAESSEISSSANDTGSGASKFSW